MVLHYFLATATVIGCFVIAGWILTIVWFFSKIVGEFRFNRLLKKRSEQEFDQVRSSWISEMKDHEFDSLDTTEIPIQFKFATEDDIATEETAAVFNIRERYPNEFA